MQGNFAGQINSIGVNAVAFSSGVASNVLNTPAGVLIPANSDYGLSPVLGEGNYVGTFQGNVEATTSATFSGNSTNVSRSDLYELLPGSFGTDTPGRHLGYFEFKPDGSLTFNTPPPPVVTWANPAGITYGTALNSVQLNAAANVPGTFAYTPTSGAVLNASNGQVLTVLFTPNDTENYSPTNRSVLIDVAPAPLSVTAANASRAFGAANPVFGGTLTGVVNGDNITATYASTATPASPVGTYAIVPTLADPSGRLGNYTAAISNGVLTVASAAPSVLSEAGLNRLSGNLNLTGLIFSGGGSDTAWFEWGSSLAYGSTTAPRNLGAGYVPASLTASLTGLTPGTVVHFRVVSSNSVGLTYGADQTTYVTSNSPPLLAEIARQTTALNTPLPIALTVSDAETAADSLAVTAWSGNTNLVPQAGLIVSGTGIGRSLLIAPAPGQWGRAVIVVTVDDGLTTTSKAFLVDVGLLPGDIDENGIVDVDDYFLLASRWYQRNTSP